MIRNVFYILQLIILVLGSSFLARVVLEKLKISRWVLAMIAPFVLIIPAVFVKNISNTGWNILFIIFSVLCIMFFEMTRLKLERHELKGIIYNNKAVKNRSNISKKR